jgi:hypothetical protein
MAGGRWRLGYAMRYKRDGWRKVEVGLCDEIQERWLKEVGGWAMR